MTITSGKFKATLYDAVRSKTPDGKQNVTFVWDLLGLDTRVSHTVCLADDYGRSDAVSSWEVEQWAKGWDRRDLDWFANQIKQGKTINAWVNIIDGKVDCVRPRGGGDIDGDTVGSRVPRDRIQNPTQESLEPGMRASGTLAPTSGDANSPGLPTTIRLKVDRAVLAQMSTDPKPTYLEAKKLFDAITAKTKKREDANLVWTLIAARIGPMQIDFTSEQWGEMIERIKMLKSCSFVVRNRRVDYSTLRVEER